MQLVFGDRLDLDPDAPTEAMGALATVLADRQARFEQLLQGTEARRAKAEERRRQLRDLLGAEGLERLVRLREHLPAPIRTTASEIEARRAERHRQKADLLRELGVDPHQLKGLRESWLDELEASTPDLTTSDSLVTPFAGGDLSPTLIDPPPPPGFFFIIPGLYGPPFDWSSSWPEGSTYGGFRYDGETFLDANAGIVGQRISLNNGDAGGNDDAHVTYFTLVSFRYQLPENGRLEIKIRAQCVHSGFHLSIVDEWGESSASSTQRNYLVAKADGVASDPWQMQMMSEFTYRGDEEGNWHEHPIAPGQVFDVRLMTQNWFPKDTWVTIQVGSVSFHGAFTNDMEFYSEVNFTWRIKSVLVGVWTG